nr:MAG TPA: hypothetical protein [Caudoviricetes sp.]DAV11943.1 MAG TPA: hypothetical protein [Caudoviricetes sp.]
MSYHQNVSRFACGWQERTEPNRIYPRGYYGASMVSGLPDRSGCGAVL